MHLKVKTDAKSGPLKREGKGEIFSTLCRTSDSANGTTINSFEVASWYNWGAPRSTPGNARKGVLQDLIKMYKKVYLRLH